MPRLLDETFPQESARVQAVLNAITAGLEPETIEQLERVAASVPDTATAFNYLLRLREFQPDAFYRIVASRTALQFLLTAFAHSHFLSEELLQNPFWVEDLAAGDDLHRVCRVDEYRERLGKALESRGGHPDAVSLAAFRRESILRILLRDVLGLGTLSEITEELSNLADAMLEVTYACIRADMVRRYGRPIEASNGGTRQAGFAVIALGKLGGGELNYSSDIDLMFVYSGNGQTEGPQRISNKEFYKKLANNLTAVLSTYTAEGLCYRVDLRLRPEGSLGEVCISLDAAKNYYEKRARDWELQMLIKARVAAGDIDTGRQLLDFVEPLIYSSTLDFSAVESMSATRDRIDEKLAARRGGHGPSAFDVKLARGGIRDIEFLVQCLQRLHGGRVAWVRHGGTLLALIRLQDKNLLSGTEYWRLASAYEFLRHLEHRLQIEEDRQTHALPIDPVALDLVARRMPAALLGGDGTRDQLLQQLNAHLEQVVTIYERVIHAQKPIYYTFNVEVSEAEEDGTSSLSGIGGRAEPVAGNLIRSLDETSPALASHVSSASLTRGLRAFEHFLERVSASPGLMRMLEEDSSLTRRLLDIFEHSPYFAEEFIRETELIFEVQAAQFPNYAQAALPLTEPAELRRFFRREMVRIQAASVCAQASIFDTLGRTSELADATIAAAYRMAVAQILMTRPPTDPDYRAVDQLMVIALGRLGMREFDLASDADLVFALPDADHGEQLFWTRVAERTIELLTAYTGEGVVFAVDTRLRPNGREGALVQTVSAFKDYFERSAEAWEGIAYMKSRAVVGNMEAATEFLHELQELDWRRYGQSGRSKKDLKQMRVRLEKEQGATNPLKAGRGGYYDIDFALMYLRLKGAGMFFKVLNTPERIDILEKMGHLEREDAAFFQDAATFYRALDHAMRVFSGHAEGSLPNSETKLAALDELVERWIPSRLHDEPLRTKVSKLRERTRQAFERLFS
jgi:glutamate-ammonia-ligase adenylyltransferase